MYYAGATPAAAVLVPRRLRGVGSPLKEELKALEVGAQGMAAAEVMAQRVGRQGGAALVVDYGKDGPYEDSLVAIQGHQGVEVRAVDGHGCAGGHGGACDLYSLLLRPWLKIRLERWRNLAHTLEPGQTSGVWPQLWNLAEFTGGGSAT